MHILSWLFVFPSAMWLQSAFWLTGGWLGCLQAKAAVAATAATPTLLKLLDAAEFRGTLSSCCPSIAHEPAARLLNRLKQALDTAELTHNFNANSSGTWEGDINITSAAAMDWLPNLWEIMYLGLTPRTDQREEDWAEVYIMGFKRFSGATPPGKAFPPSRAEAAERPIYTTANMFRLNIGNPTFGDVSLILRPSVARPLALLSPLDTGNWEDHCNASTPRPAQCTHFPYAVDCSAWDLTQGTFDHPEHTLLANALLWNSTTCT